MNLDLHLGAHVHADDSATFRVWAPRARHLAVELGDGSGRTAPLEAREGDLFEATLPEIGAGIDYLLVLDGARRCPDPASRHQPRGVHGPSRTVRPESFRWTDDAFVLAPLREQILYELHVGTFTEEGTFAAILPKLPHLRDLGVTAIELMPVAEFPGSRNWGYDGVHLFAPQSTYGGPDGLRALVDACHRHGIGVVLDVVYNHLGPEGNYLSEFAPYFSARHRTPWGDGLNLDGPNASGVRRHLVSNAVHWIREYHLDGLRLDAIDHLRDATSPHLLVELGRAVHAAAAASGREVLLIGESDRNDVQVLTEPERGGLGMGAQWSDDFHHAVVATLTGARHGKLVDFGRLADVEAALTKGFVFDGRASIHRGCVHGTSLGDRPGSQLVVFLQNHDQVANTAAGARLASSLDAGRQRLAAALLFVAPNVPMVFMGEEFGERAPFHYFIDHGERALIEAVVRGRREEHRVRGSDRDPADPSLETTFSSSKLGWGCLALDEHRRTLALYADLIALRRRHVALSSGRRDLTRASSSEDGRWLSVERVDPSGEDVLALFNASESPRVVPARASRGTYRLALSTDEPRYGGEGATSAPEGRLEIPGSGHLDVEIPALTAHFYVRTTDGGLS